MKPQRVLGGLFRRNKAAAKTAPPKTEAEKASLTGANHPAGIAMHKPPTGLG